MASPESLKDLSAQYSNQFGQADIDDLRILACEYVKMRTASILEAAAIGLAFDVVFSESTLDASKITPDMANAWTLAYPSVPIESLLKRPRNSIADVISGWKSKLFRIEVLGRLNNGDWVGDLHLEKRQHAKSAFSTNQRKHNFQIIDDDILATSSVQLQAIEPLNHVLQALDCYLNTSILTTQDTISTSVENETVTAPTNDPLVTSPIEPVRLGLIEVGGISSIVLNETLKTLASGGIAKELFVQHEKHAPKEEGLSIETGLVTVTPLIGEFANFLVRISFRPETEDTIEQIVLAPNLNRLRTSASRFGKFVCGFKPLYPCPERRERSSQIAPSISDHEEFLLLVDTRTRLALLRGTMPLDRWIESMVEREISTMNETALIRHLSDLDAIKADNLVDKAFIAKGFLERWASAMTGGCSHLKEKLDDAMEIGRLTLNKFSGSVTIADAERIESLKASRFDSLAEIRNERQRKVYRFIVRPQASRFIPRNDHNGFRLRDLPSHNNKIWHGKPLFIMNNRHKYRGSQKTETSEHSLRVQN